MAKATTAPVEQTASAEDKLFSEAGNINFPYFKFEKPGDRVAGFYVGYYDSVSSKYGYNQRNYVLEQKDGAKLIIAGRNASKDTGVRIIFGMEKIPFGGYVGFIYEGDKDTGKGNPAKIIRPKYLGERDESVYEKFKKMYNLEEVKESAEAEGAETSDVPDFS